ncbi:MAG TPA: hypothetical protein VF760_12500, partial [Xanthobacteraceae bacterium]
PCELSTLRPAPLPLACKHERKMKANFCPHPPSRCRNPARSLNPLLHNDLRADCGNKNVEYG